MISRSRRLVAGLHGFSLEHPPAPRILILALTGRCNLRCFMCNVHMDDPPGGAGSQADMPDELFRKIEPLIARAQVINLGGCGEPLISRNIRERLQRIRALNPGAHLLTFTNGLALSSPEKANALLPFFDELHLSLNGVDSYDRVMTGARFPVILRNLEVIRDVREKTGRPEQLVLGFIVMRRNLADIVPAARLAREMGFTRIQYKNLWVFNEPLKAESIHHDPGALAAARAEILQARETGIPVECEMWPEYDSPSPRKWGIVRHEHTPEFDENRPPLLVRAGRMMVRNPRLFRTRLWRFVKAYGRHWLLALSPAFRQPPCSFPWTQVQVFENGYVLLCCQGGTEVGNLQEEPFEAMWSGEEAQRYRTGLLTGNYYKDCARCKLLFPDQAGVFEKIPVPGQPLPMSEE
jgi:MoaA/NifB/PqqE/SkfB family radical SAM enzyme